MRQLLSRERRAVGTTPVGGGHTLGEGGVFALTPTGSTYVERDLHLFVGSPNDGSYPLAGLLNGSGGVLFGTTQLGGSSQACGNETGCGTVYELRL